LKRPLIVGSIFAGALLCIVALIYKAIDYRARSAEAERQQRLMAEFDSIRTASGFATALLWDPEILDRLLNSPQCAAKVDSVLFRWVDLADDGWDGLKQLPNLAEITVYQCDHVDALFRRIEHQSSIQDISLIKTDITDAGMQSMATLPRLKRLYYQQSRACPSPAPLAAVSTIEVVKLAGLPDDEIVLNWLDVLKRLPNLHELELEESPVSHAVIEKFRKEVPHCAVVNH
jgi:hypothetical protein